MERRNWIREPLFHFLIVGIAVFAIVALVRPPGQGDSHVIVLQRSDLVEIAGRWEDQTGRPPTSPELATLVQNRLRDEVLYREATALGLAEGDPVIRRHLIEKVFSRTQAGTELPEPTKEELQHWLEGRRETYRIPAKISFSHVYFSKESRGDQALTDANAVLAALTSQPTPVERPWERGDAFPLEHEYTRLSQNDMSQVFGTDFADQVIDLEPGEWHGPIESVYGFHLVVVREETPPRDPSLDEVLQRVSADWRAAQLWNPDEPAFDVLAAKYRVEPEPDAKALLKEREIDLAEVMP